jgi:hypothetical protein
LTACPQIVSGIACIFCGLLQGQEDPDVKNLQVNPCQLLPCSEGRFVAVVVKSKIV